MKVPRAPHAWALSARRAIAVQRRLARLVSQAPPPGPLRLVAGLDAAFITERKQCVAGVVLWDAAEQRVVEQHTALCPLTFPYVPGLLSFREAPALLAALRKLEQPPDVLMCDGQGLAHPRRFGIACHLGLICRLPALGCAKSRLIGVHDEPRLGRGATTPLHHQGAVVGVVLRTQTGIRPVYLSVGHLLDLATAERIALGCAVRYRLPEPTRLADHLVAQTKRILLAQHAIRV